MNGRVLFAGLALAILSSFSCCFGQQTVQPPAQAGVVFQIGKFDGSWDEFAQGAPREPVNFIVGAKSTAKDWFAQQPSILSSAIPSSTAGQSVSAVAAAPRKITFNLSNSPTGWYRLHIAVLIGTSVPDLRITVNGKHGTFYLHPHLDLSGNQDGSNSIFSRADVRFDFPGTYLHKGTNVIALEAIEEGSKQRHDAGFGYDAISLRHLSSSETLQDANPSALIVPTVFYKRQQGQIDELVDVFLRYHSHPKQGSTVSLAINRKRYSEEMTSSRDFGDVRLEFLVAEFPANSTAKVDWVVSGRRRHLEETISPEKKWTIYLVPHIHLDIGYTDARAKVAAIQSRVLDEAMDFSVQHPGFRFSLDGEWPLAQFWSTRTAAEQSRALDAIKNGRIFVPAQYANLLTGFASAEVLIRSLYPSANFSRQHGTPFNYANITDVPTYSWSYPSILASAGIEDLIAGSNNGRAPVMLQGRLQEKSPMWWEGPDGKKVLFWYSHDYSQMWDVFGMPPLITTGRDLLPLFLQTYEHPNYLASAAIMYGTQWENTDLYPQQASLADKWNAIYAYPRFEYSGFHHALYTIAGQFHGKLPTISGGGGPYWEDGVASDAYFAAIERGNESRGPSAEKLETLASLTQPGIAADTSRLHRMWRDMVLMDEHTFTAHNSVGQPRAQLPVHQLKAKNQLAVNARSLSDWLSQSSMATIANSVSAGPGSLIVFNMLNWSRNGLVSIDLPDGDAIIDRTRDQVVPYSTVLQGRGFRRVRFLAEHVPPVGYKVYSIKKASSLQPDAATSTDVTMENPYYRVELDPASGSVKSIYDKQLHRELVNRKSPYHFGEYLYVTGGGDGPSRLLEYTPDFPEPRLNIHPAHDGSLVSVTRTPWGWLARMKSSDINTPSITTEIRLFNGEKKIEFIEDLDKKYVTSKEGVYFAFPFAVDHPQFQYEIQNGVLDPAKDMLPGAGHEWFSVQHWVSVQGGGVSGTVMPLDASLVTLGDINRGAWPDHFGSRPATIFSYVMNNYWNTNYVAGQGGHFRFRYVITSAAATDPEGLSRMGWEETTPLDTDEVTSQDKAQSRPEPFSGKQKSFLNVGDPDLFLETWKPAEDGDGSILRFIDLGGEPRTVTIHTPLLHLSEAWLTDSVERNHEKLPLVGTDGFSFPVRRHGIVTVRLLGTPTTR